MLNGLLRGLDIESKERLHGCGYRGKISVSEKENPTQNGFPVGFCFSLFINYMKHKSFDELEMNKYKEILENTDTNDSLTYKVNKMLYEISVDIYNLTQRQMKHKMYYRNKDDAPVKKKMKNN